MRRVLGKRIRRDLKENLLRYLALALLIIACMYLVISLVGAADTIIMGVEQKGEELCLEDGEFTVFVPLTEREEERLSGLGAELERMFSMDFSAKEGSTLRVFIQRETINRIALDEGRLAAWEQEAVLEKRYCEEHGITVGDKIAIGGIEFKVTGIGAVPDYDAPYRNLSDSSVDSSQFGLAFVTEESYEALARSGGSGQAEEYVYAYRLRNGLTSERLREEVKKLKVDPENVEDIYFREYWEELAGDADELEEALRELTDGSKELADGLSELVGHSGDLTGGAGEVLDAYLREANSSLEEFGLEEELTEENYARELEKLKESSGSGIVRMAVGRLLRQLDALKEYKDGVEEYADGVGEAADGAGELNDGIRELEEGTQELLDELGDTELKNLTQFLTAEDNPRIKASADDQVINKLAGLIAGVIGMILFTYVISVFVIHGIERESAVIGALYALGVKQRDLLLHYLTLPVAVTLAAGVLGTALGYSSLGVKVQMEDCYAYFSIPELDVVYSGYLLAYGILMPPAAAALVNCIVIRRRLSLPALQLMRGGQKAGRLYDIRLGGLGFVGRFRIRQMLREARTGLTVIFGMFVSLLVLMLAVDCYVLCENFSLENKADTKFACMYTYKYPEKEVPEGGEACYARTLKKEVFGYWLDVTLLGIDGDNPYFDAEVSDQKSEVVISSAMAQKYALSPGDKVILTDEEADMDYVFTVKDITQYSVGMYAFMDIGRMREFFGEDEDYYNVVFADHALDIEPGRLYATVTREEIYKSSDVFTELMMSMIWTMTIVAALVFCVVMYLMMKVMVDRAAMGISLIKIFGYRPGEVRRLYLNGNFYIIAAGAALGVPASKYLMDAMFPVMVSNVACGINLTFSRELYAGIYLGILALYFVINRLLVRRINRVSPAEILKNRE